MFTCPTSALVINLKSAVLGALHICCLDLDPRGFTLQNTTPRATLQFSKWDPFHSITGQALSDPHQFMTIVRIVSLIQIPNTL